MKTLNFIIPNCLVEINFTNNEASFLSTLNDVELTEQEM